MANLNKRRTRSQTTACAKFVAEALHISSPKDTEFITEALLISSPTTDILQLIDDHLSSSSNVCKPSQEDCRKSFTVPKQLRNPPKVTPHPKNSLLKQQGQGNLKIPAPNFTNLR
jgi:hypothetical protein